MNKKKLVPLLLLIALVAVLGIALFALSRLSADSTVKDTTIPLSTMESAAVDSVSYTTSDGVSVSLKKQGDAWQDAEDAKMTLDQSKVNTLVESLVGLKALRELPQGETADVSTYGLDAPAMQFTAAAGTDTFSFKVGAINAMTSAYYVQLSGSDTVYTVSSDSLADLPKTIENLYGAVKITELTEANLTAMTVETPGQTLRFAKSGSGDDAAWALAEDEGYALNQDTVKLMANTVCNLETTWTITKPEAAAAYGLDAPNAIITLAADDGTGVQLKLGNTTPDGTGCYAALTGAEDVVYEVNGEALKAYAYTKDTLAATQESATADTADTSAGLTPAA